MTRQIKRTRQIEDFVIEKLARRGLISEKEKENPVQFVKNLQSVESINQLINRKSRSPDQEQALLNIYYNNCGLGDRAFYRFY